MSDAPLYVQAHDYAATIIGAAIGMTIARDPETTPEPAGDGAVKMAAALISGDAPVETGFLLGAVTPYEFEQRGRLEILVAGGEPAAREASVNAALKNAAGAIAADPTLGGRVEYAELAGADLNVVNENGQRAARYWSADLVLTYSAPNALG